VARNLLWPPPEPVACRTWEAARLLGVGDGTFLRLARVDPDFPKPFRLCEGGVRLWPVPELKAYAERKAGRAFTRAAFELA
jgi:predicted DNA-binding transcriptional regulator AlpA